MSWTKITIGGQKVLDADAFLARLDRRPGWAKDVNRLTCPPGTQPGRGVFLLSRDSIDALNLASQHDIVWETDLGSKTFHGYVLRQAFEAIPASNSPMVVTVEDQRRLMLDSFTDKQHNVKLPGDPNYYPGTGTYTWQQIFDRLWFDVGPRGSYTFTFDLDSALIADMPAINLCNQTHCPWLELRRLAAMLHGEVQFQPTEQKVYVRSTKGYDITAATELAGKKPIQNLRPKPVTFGHVPATVTVLFHRWPNPPTVADKPLAIDVTTSSIASLFPEFAGTWLTADFTRAVVWSHLIAFRNSGTGTSNITQLTSAANSIAASVVAGRLREALPQRVRYADLVIPTSEDFAYATTIWHVLRGQTYTDFMIGSPPPLDRGPWMPPYPDHSGILVEVPSDDVAASDGSTLSTIIQKVHVLASNGSVAEAQDTDGNAVYASAGHLGPQAIEYDGAGHKVQAKPLGPWFVIDVDYC